MRLLAALLSIVAQAAAAETLSPLPEDAAVQVTVLRGKDGPVTWSMGQSSEQRKQLIDWVAKHQAGWQVYLATPPGRGIIVDAPELRLQFTGSTVLACQKAGPCLQKAVKPIEYAFLAKNPNATEAGKQ